MILPEKQGVNNPTQNIFTDKTRPAENPFQAEPYNKKTCCHSGSEWQQVFSIFQYKRNLEKSKFLIFQGT